MIALLLALGLIGPLRPNPRLTPGAVRSLTTAEICGTTWGRDRRHVTEAMKKHVAQRYGVAWSKRSLYEFDHLIPRELGGADDEANLWPQPWDLARVKDRDENRLHRAVCAGQVALDDAQQQMRRWGR